MSTALVAELSQPMEMPTVADDKFRHFVISHNRGVLAFKHKPRTGDRDRGLATYNYETRAWWSSQGMSFKKYFEGYRFLETWHHRRWPDGRENMREDFANIADVEFANFIIHTVLDSIHEYTRHSSSYSVHFLLSNLALFEKNRKWNQLGIKTYRLMHYEPSDVDKDVLRILRESQFEFNSSSACSPQIIPLFSQLIRALDLEKVPCRQIVNHRRDYTYAYYNTYRPEERNVWDDLVEHLPSFQNLLNRGYAIQDTIRYLFNYLVVYEGYSISDALRDLDDYARMQTAMGVTEFKKYPKYLKSNHDIVRVEFQTYEKYYQERLNEVQRQQQEAAFSAAVKKELAFESKTFVVLVPDCMEAVRNEGRQLSHCVGSYVDRIIQGQTQILFLRDKETPEKSRVTIEVRDNVLIQAKGLANRSITKEEREMIDAYAREKNLLVRL